uniref:CSON006697 protein n=1 Tax=Culicoides sonorensis TaxID=179676 RepID=A0A336M0N9_CULSO
MSPMGFAVHRQARHLAQAKENSSDEEWETSGDTTDIVRPVPIWLCFGDFVPAQNVKDESQRIILALTSLYLLFGIALLAMSFNLVQEEVIASVKNVAKKLGILKEEEYED